MVMKDPKYSAASVGMSTIEIDPRPEQNVVARRLISTTSS